MAGDPALPPMLTKAALASACIVGVFVLMHMMSEFSSALKPLVLSTMLAGCLETFVQFFEIVIIRSSQLLRCCLCCECWPIWPKSRRGARRKRNVAGAELERLLDADGDARGMDEPGCLPHKVTAEWGKEEAGELFLPRLIAVLGTLTVASFCISALVSALINALKGLDFDVYKKGFTQLQDEVVELTQRISPDVQAQVSANLTSLSQKVGDFLMGLVNDVLASLTNILMQSIMFLLYSLMWLLKPVREGKQVFLIVRTYFMYKSFSNLVFSVLVFVLLTWLKVDLAVVVALVCFFLGFIPEIGAFIALALPVPLLLFDARRTLADRACGLVNVLLGMLLIKFAVSNGLESVMMGKSQTLAGQYKEGAKVEETHPVLLLFIVVLCGDVWGATGMLISVPLVSLVRLTFNLELEAEEEFRQSRRAEQLGDGV